MAKKRRKRRSRKGQIFGILSVTLVLCCALGINSFQLNQKIKSYSAEISELEAQIEDEQIYSEELARESDYVKTDEYKESVARNKLGLVKDDEIIFKKQNN